MPVRITLGEAAALDTAPEPPEEGALILGVGGDTLTPVLLDSVEHGPGVLVLGPRRSGRSSALVSLARQAVAAGRPAVAITARRSPLRTEVPDGIPQFTHESERTEVEAAVRRLLDADDSVLLLDDLELMGLDGWLPELVDTHAAALRDRAGLIVAAGSLEDLGSTYRGPAVTLKKSRTGVLLSPQSPGDGDLLGVRLPRSAVGGSAGAGRGMFVAGGALQGIQLVLPD